MSQPQKDRDFIGRFCARWNCTIGATKRDDRWTVRAGHNNNLMAEAIDHDEALHMVAEKLHAALVKDNQTAVDKMIKEVTANQAVIGDWPEE